ncbi:hypothetical protein QBC40DRAFT_295914 [Triangularia verruculosa]|uniref:Uncharacterized protein n=1 Tax=Triangularia verruculosa TaxID=2587418 RepID=A0AAN6XJ33_9PEZI|nr:hypothetical protein QBC40DRAFT_295914 [Triangularia verruculosa]
MAQVYTSCELMDHAFPARPVNLKGRFFVAHDVDGDPMIFSANDRGALCLIMKGDDGNNNLVNLSAKFGLAETERVTTFAGNQNQDGIIHFAFATRQQEGLSRVTIVEPLKPNRDVWLSQDSLVNCKLKGQERHVDVIDLLVCPTQELAVSKPRAPLGSSFVYVVLKSPGKATEDVHAISTNVATHSWTWDETVELPSDIDRILQICPGKLKMYRGLFVLFRNRKQSTHLRFFGRDPTADRPIWRTLVQHVPVTPLSKIACYQKGDSTDLLLSTPEGLVHRTSDECFKASRAYSVISSDAAYSETSQLHVAKSFGAEQISAWVLSKDNRLSYQEFSISNTAPHSMSDAITLMGELQGDGTFAALHSPIFGQRLFVMEGDHRSSTLKMLTQSLETRIWNNPRDILIPDSDNVTIASSYTIRVTFKGDNGLPLAHQPLLLHSSISAEMTINGRCITSTPSQSNQAKVSTDEEGILTILIPLSEGGIGAPTVTLSDVSDSCFKVFSKTGGSLTIDPMSKFWSKIKQIDSVDALKGLDFVKDDVADEELERMVVTLQKLYQVRKKMSSDSSGNSILRSAIESSLSRFKADPFWGALYQVAEKIDHTWSCTVDEVNEAWKFAIRIGQQTWDFVLQNAPQVAAAMQTVLAAIAESADRVADWLKFHFDWDDILAVKNVLVNVTTQSLLMCSDSIAFVELKAMTYLEDIRSKARQLKEVYNDLPPEIRQLGLGKQEIMVDPSIRGDSEELRKARDILNSPQAHEILNYLKPKSTGETTISPRTEGQSTLERIMLRVGIMWRELDQLASRLSVNILELFGSLASGDTLTLERLIQTVGFDLLDDFAGLIESLVTAILGSLSDIILALADSMNHVIHVPVLSTIYKGVTNGGNLTVLDAVCLAIAVPTTLVYKVITKERPTAIKGIEPLTHPDIMRPDLDERMGRLKDKKDQVEEQPIKVETAKKALQASVERFEKRGGRSGKKITKLASIILDSTWFTIVTVPFLWVPDKAAEAGNFNFGLSAVFKAFLWFARGGLLLLSGGGDSEFWHTFGKTLGGKAGVVAGCLQLVLLVMGQFDRWKRLGKDKFPWFLTAQEFTKFTGKMLVYATGMTPSGAAYVKAPLTGAVVVFGFKTRHLAFDRICWELKGRHDDQAEDYDPIV